MAGRVKGYELGASRRNGQISTVDWTLFYPPGTLVLALPSWKSPRLYLPVQHFSQRWDASSFYPASRTLARLYRLSLRARAAARLAEVRQVQSGVWPLGAFVRDVLPEVESAVTLVGTPGPAQKITARLLGGQGEVLGYLKYAHKEAARFRLRQEHRLLCNLPAEVGPDPLKFGSFADGEALLTTVLEGEKAPTSLPPADDLMDFLGTLAVSPSVPLEAHPWAKRIREEGSTKLEYWFESLADKSWPVVVQHGDLAPWNLLRKPDGTLGAIDWEYGVLDSFPHLDLAYYVLQIMALVRRQSPAAAAEYTIRYLNQDAGLTLSSKEARALTSLAAYDAYTKSREDGQPDDVRLQAWRRVIWERKAQDF